MGGDGKGGCWKGGGQKRKHQGDQSSGRKHAFKILCPDALITSVMGKGGVRKDQIQEETSCKLVFSNRDEFFPGTHFRTLCIYGDEPGAILSVIDKVIDHIIECGEHEQRNSHWGDGDFTGKESGEFALRSLISSRMSGAIIGSKGSNIQAIRDENNAKIFIEKQSFSGHYMMRVIATPDGLRSALARLNDCVQSETEGEDFVQWAPVRHFSEEDAGGGKGKGKEVAKGSGKVPRKGGAAGGEQGHVQPNYGKVATATPALPQGGSWQAPSGAEAANGHADAELPEVDQGVLQALSATISEFPAGALEMEYTLSCEMPSQKVPHLLGENDEHVDSVMESTGTRVAFEDATGSEDGQQTLTINGPLLRVYRAHALMMRRYHEAEAAEAAREAEAAEPSVQQLQEQVQQLQKQLMMMQQSTMGGKGKGKKG